MADNPVADDWVIIVRLWWEKTSADEVAMRARLTTTVNGSIAGTPSAAATVEGVLQAVRVSVERFLQNPPTTGVTSG
ncbi:hypothetical protein [Mycobacterium sp. OTB74]|uniref:hypothetical protein n=1 Tax=Mycobacterium sp. OTB74 TaxID=1853452 RepID=UPI0024742426|nr:hypothetical protein [Mycobacterium sp. OTB74]MDH6243229.1 hypothetical protein [Mycobacterium sp. OTB74]